MNRFKVILKFLLDQKSTIGYSLMALFTLGGERVFNRVSFQCPCNHQQNFAYGLTFLLGPAVVLLVLGLFLSTRFWKLFTGCCLNPKKLLPKKNNCDSLPELMSVFWGACVVPIMWLCIALMSGTFYECAASGLKKHLVVDHFCKNKTIKCLEELAQVPCERSKLPSEERAELRLMFKAQSQILGWSIIIIAVVAALLGICLRYSCSEVSYLQLTFWKHYMEKEKEHLNTFTVKYASKLAKRNIKSFFENKPPGLFPLQTHEAWKKISTYSTFSKGKECYSNLHQYVEMRDWDLSLEEKPVQD
ncbi:calcium homeostasis modulator protein 5-like [Xyrichtys novacula]|uniref:Calcium homeostasis modulator protein 5-like n=1 Tax=Xyrichtys novacula TaxID=13765 RepID=A0AAV1FJ84_XYRNO|nr:calcium homeostasis modulator protein 5-like [Xyrichtys novacula]